MNISNIVGALFPIFFVLALGYLAGKRHTFDADQAAGFSKLALSFALPASLFVSMTGIPRDLLLGQGRLVLALILSHVGLFVIAWIALKQIASLRGTPAIIYSLMLATSATPVFGLAVLEPILGASSAGAVALVALAINLTVPLAIVLLEMDAAARNRADALIRSRQRIHAGRMLSEHPSGVPDLRPDEARDSKTTAELVVRRILDWLEKFPPSPPSSP